MNDEDGVNLIKGKKVCFVSDRSIVCITECGTHPDWCECEGAGVVDCVCDCPIHSQGTTACFNINAIKQMTGDVNKNAIFHFYQRKKENEKHTPT